MKDLHPVQISILKQLLFRPRARFSELNQTELTNDHFTFHIKELVRNGFIEKDNDGYILTPTGTELAGRIDVSSEELISPPKLGVAVCLWKDTEAGKQVLLNKRKKQQAFGQTGLHTEKVRFGEKIIDTVHRCIAKEIGDVQTEIDFVGISHILEKTDQEISNDVVLHCFSVKYLSGDISMENAEGENGWHDVKELGNISGLMSGLEDLIPRIIANKKFFDEIETD